MAKPWLPLYLKGLPRAVYNWIISENYATFIFYLQLLHLHCIVFDLGIGWWMVQEYEIMNFTNYFTLILTLFFLCVFIVCLFVCLFVVVVLVVVFHLLPRPISDGFLLIEGKTEIPCVRWPVQKISYKYIVEKAEQNKTSKMRWEHLIEVIPTHGKHVNRCLDIPQQHQIEGSK